MEAWTVNYSCEGLFWIFQAQVKGKSETGINLSFAKIPTDWSKETLCCSTSVTTDAVHVSSHQGNSFYQQSYATFKRFALYCPRLSLKMNFYVYRFASWQNVMKYYINS